MVNKTSFHGNNDERQSPYSILILIPHYLPGNKSGGPVRSIENMVDRLGDEFKFYIITSCRDLGEKLSYPNIRKDQWVQVKKAQVMYLSVQQQNIIEIYKLLKKTNYDLLYLNGIFSRLYSMFPIGLSKIGLLDKAPILISTKGEVSQGALRIKFLRKRFFLSLAKSIGLYKMIYWHVSSSFEKVDLIKNLSIRDSFIQSIVNIPSADSKKIDLGKVASNIYTAEDFAKHYNFTKENQRDEFLEKETGKIKIIFLSRISRKKNLSGALALLKDLPGDIQFHIYGPIEDENYWNKCRIAISNLSSNIKIEYKGIVEHDEVLNVFKSYHLFLFPTFSENYGHVILESLLSGCPVLISDQTFWRNLEKQGVGWDIPLDNPLLFRQILQTCIDMDSTVFQKISQRARQYALNQTKDPSSVEKHREMFREIIKAHSKEDGNR